MSRGPGNIQRAILEALGFLGRASGPRLCGVVFSEQTEAARVSTRRALRGLVRRGLVAALGFNCSGERVYCLQAERDMWACMWGNGIGAGIGRELWGKRYQPFMARVFYSGRVTHAFLAAGGGLLAGR